MIDADLKELGYSFRPEGAIWARPEFKGIQYSDGEDIENEIMRKVCESSDRSVLSDELANSASGWAETYHFSKARANVLRPFESALKGDILEIGGGCGAITRFLGETGANVVTVEGSVRRAEIARKRTEELTNVFIVADQFESFNFQKKFDVVTLIGVLEYAGIYCKDENPAEAMLEKVLGFLKPGGHLIIAIENKLGLKYFAGANEDHMGTPMYGIEDMYQKGEVRTFGRMELEKLIGKVGFSHSEFLAPFPDYKMPSSIITEKGMQDFDFDAAELAVQSVHKDLQNREFTNFMQECAWRGVVGNGLGMDLANSFIVVASKSNGSICNESPLAYHYSTGRKAIFCKQSVFLKSNTGKISVESRTLRDTESIAGKVSQIVEPIADYKYGTILVKDFTDIISREGWTVSEVVEFMGNYIEALRQICSRRGDKLPTDFSGDVPGYCFDLMPHNILMVNGVPCEFDMEWLVSRPISLSFILIRSLYVLVRIHPYMRPNGQNAHFTFKEFVTEVMSGLGNNCEDVHISEFLEIEDEIINEITGIRVRERLNEFMSRRLQESPNTIQLSYRVHDLEVLLAEKEQQVNSMLNSRSWRVTKPLRKAVRVYGKYKNLE